MSPASGRVDMVQLDVDGRPYVYSLHDVRYSPGCVARLFAGEPERVLGITSAPTSWLSFGPMGQVFPLKLLMATGGHTVWFSPLSPSRCSRSPREPTPVFATSTGTLPEPLPTLVVATSMHTPCRLKTGGATTMLKTGGALKRPLPERQRFAPQTGGAGVGGIDALFLLNFLELLRPSHLLPSWLPALDLRRSLRLPPRLPSSTFRLRTRSYPNLRLWHLLPARFRPLVTTTYPLLTGSQASGVRRTSSRLCFGLHVPSIPTPLPAACFSARFPTS
jgi:hypothetical protein